jgi:hypothetical protein
MSRSRGGRAVALALAVPALLALVLAQALLPGVAADHVRARIAAYGQVHSVHVSAFPALELLWGQAGSVSVSAGKLTITPMQAASMLWEARGLGTLDIAASAVVLRAPLLARGLEVERVRMRTRGAQLNASATFTQAQLTSALPSGVAVEPIASGSGEVEARASGGLFGLQTSLNVLVRAVEGRLIAEPHGLPFGSVVAVTLFSDPHVKVLAVGLRVLRSNPLSYEATLTARLS